MRQPNEFGDEYIIQAFATKYERRVVVWEVRAHPDTPLCDPCVKLSIDKDVVKIKERVVHGEAHCNSVFLLYHDEPRRVSACAQTLALTTHDE